MPNSGVIKFDRFLIATTAAAAPDDDSADVPLELQQEQSAGTWHDIRGGKGGEGINAIRMG